MKNRGSRKKLIIAFIISLTLLLVGFSLYATKSMHQKNIAQKEAQLKAEKIALINEKYGKFANNELVSEEDELGKFLNGVISTHNIVDVLSITELSLKELTDPKASLNEAKNTLKLLNELHYDNIDSYLDDYLDYEKKEIKHLYNSNNIVQELDKDKEKIANLKELLNTKIKLLEFFNNNSNKYKTETSRLTYTSDSFISDFKDLNIPVSFKMEKIDLGKPIPILEYHGVSDSPWGDTSLFMGVKAFDSQMEYLYNEGYTTLFLTEIGEAYKYDKPVVITFDDGYIDMYTTAYPIMKKYNFKSNMYIITNWLDGVTYMTKEMVQELDKSGLVQIGSHTLNHVHLSSLSEEKQEEELKNSKEYLETLLGKEINTIAYPYGQRNATTLKIAKKYYRYAVTTEPGFNYSKTYAGSSLLLKRLKASRGISLNSFINLLATDQ